MAETVYSRGLRLLLLLYFEEVPSMFFYGTSKKLKPKYLVSPLIK